MGALGPMVGGKADHHVQAAGAGGEIGAGDVEVAEFDDEMADEHPATSTSKVLITSTGHVSRTASSISGRYMLPTSTPRPA